jgi:hypothetical protein
VAEACGLTHAVWGKEVRYVQGYGRGGCPAVGRGARWCAARDRRGGDALVRRHPQIIAFDNEEFLGDHMHIFGNMRDLGKWGNTRSSMIILSGTWEFFGDEDFKGIKMGELGPGMYANVADKGLKNNSISSVRLASSAKGSTR